jgi:hypothetical protein
VVISRSALKLSQNMMLSRKMQAKSQIRPIYLVVSIGISEFTWASSGKILHFRSGTI